MTAKQISQVLVAAIVFIYAVSVQSGEISDEELRSLDALNRNYRGWSYVKDAIGNVYFRGIRKDLNPKYAPLPTLLRYSPKSGNVTEAIPRRLLQDFQKHGELGKLSVDDQGEKIAFQLIRSAAEGKQFADILLADVRAQSVTMLVSDDRNNYDLSISPDGRFIAYYSNDATTMGISGRYLEYCAGKTVDTMTGKTQVHTEPFHSDDPWFFGANPQWLDHQRVLFSTLSDDDEFIRSGLALEQVRNVFVSRGRKYCPYAAVFDLVGNKSGRLFMPGGHLPPQFAVDREKGRAYFAENSNDSKQIIVRTDFDLSSPTSVLELGPGERIFSLRVDGGMLKYNLGAKPQTAALAN